MDGQLAALDGFQLHLGDCIRSELTFIGWKAGNKRHYLLKPPQILIVQGSDIGGIFRIRASFEQKSVVR